MNNDQADRQQYRWGLPGGKSYADARGEHAVSLYKNVLKQAGIEDSDEAWALYCADNLGFKLTPTLLLRTNVAMLRAQRILRLEGDSETIHQVFRFGS